MVIVSESSRIGLVARSNTIGCELCSAQSVVATTSVIITNARGAIVQLAACDRCVRAIHRIAATTGGHAGFGFGDIDGTARPAIRATPRSIRAIAAPVLVQTLTQRFHDATGTSYLVDVLGRERIDGTWEGWLEFIAIGASINLRTGTETTQSNREHLAYWALGLNPAYLEGAFARAQRRSARSPANSPLPAAPRAGRTPAAHN